MHRLKGFLAGMIPLAWWLAAKWGWIGLWKIGNFVFTPEDEANFITNFVSMIHVWIILTIAYEIALFAVAIWLLVKPWYRQGKDDEGLTAAVCVWGVTLGWIVVLFGWHLCDTDYATRELCQDSDWSYITGFGWLIVIGSAVMAANSLLGSKRVEQ